MIPKCIQLNDEQRNKFDQFAAFINDLPGRYDEETCEMSSAFTWHAFTSGIGDTLYVTAMGYRCHLEYDDDGKIIEGWQHDS